MRTFAEVVAAAIPVLLLVLVIEGRITRSIAFITEQALGDALDDASIEQDLDARCIAIGEIRRCQEEGNRARSAEAETLVDRSFLGCRTGGADGTACGGQHSLARGWSSEWRMDVAAHDHWALLPRVASWRGRVCADLHFANDGL
jgi:hypothetical protein